MVAAIAMLYPMRQGLASTSGARSGFLSTRLGGVADRPGVNTSARNPAHEIVRDTFALRVFRLGSRSRSCRCSRASPAFAVARARAARGQRLPRASGVIVAGRLGRLGHLLPVLQHRSCRCSTLAVIASRAGTTRRANAAGTDVLRRLRRDRLILGLVINPGLVAIFVPGGSSPRALAVAAAVISAINLHHFLLDGRIWRMREKRVAQAFAG